MLWSAMCDVYTKQLYCCPCQCHGQWLSGCDVNTEQLSRCLSGQMEVLRDANLDCFILSTHLE